ncbi:hypothetical protein Zmor_005421 [Zophobas morio]|uniref:Titin-like n=1 Tax=Zophobas morio TaxID=2755281 RepID=A0AA38MLN1_9CUCU|nr:hypothetical protein Zmor_005421 [Zophobas morio]
MSARSVLKLFTKTCSYSLNSGCSPCISNVTPQTSLRKHNRSCSYSPKRRFYELRNISKSVENLRESRYKDEEFEASDTEDPRLKVNKFPSATDLSVRDPAKEFKDAYTPPQEVNDEGNPIYELAEGSRTQENYFDVNYYMRKLELDKAKRLFMDLQPNNLRPFGSTHNFYEVETVKKRYKIVYPDVTPPNPFEMPTKRKVDDIHHKDFSSYARNTQPQKESVGSNKPNEISMLNYSTTCSTRTFKSNFSKRAKTTLGSNTENLDDKPNKDGIFDEQAVGVDQGLKEIRDHERLIRRTALPKKECAKEALTSHYLDLVSNPNREYTTQTKTDKGVCDEYVTVKLSELQEECRKAKKCKPKKISLGRLPKIDSPLCPCTHKVDLKEGKPLNRLKKRFVYKDVVHVCKEEVCDTPRADADYKITPKKLPIMECPECPCVEVEMTDLIIKRLPKKKIPEPPRVCVECVGEECCPPRADGKIIVEKKNLPKLEPSGCPCFVTYPKTSPTLKRLVPLPVKEPERICVTETCDVTLRADHNLKIEKKVLPVLAAGCDCQPPRPMMKGEPLKRMKKFKYVDKPRVCKVEEKCEETIRADSKLKPEKKKLPVFVSTTCPCRPPAIPSVDVKLKRLQPKPLPPEKEKICVEEVCQMPRADEGMIVEPKQLPILEARSCPCPTASMKDGPPLKKLVPKPVEEPPKICPVIGKCLIPRSDDDLKVKAKKLPALTAGTCPCKPPEPPHVMRPLPKLKKKPVTYQRVCKVEKVECTERADEHLKVKVKRLPKLEVPECACRPPAVPDKGTPLKRLKKVHIPEPPRICKKEDDCEDIPRADEDDWLYWKRSEVKSAECEPPKKTNNNRSFSTTSRRSYSTRVTSDYDLFDLQYDVPGLLSDSFKKQPNNIIIDIKPSALLILTQKQLELNKDSTDAVLTRTQEKRSKSEPVENVKFVIFKSNSLVTSKPSKESSSEVSFSTKNRFISTCSAVCQGPREEPHLQPKNRIIPEKEHFITPYPSDDEIEHTLRKSRRYNRTRKSDTCEGGYETRNEATHAEVLQCKEEVEEEKKTSEECEKEEVVGDKCEKKISLWERVVSYFKARPNCPSPAEYKRMRLREEAERAAQAAGLCLYDPKELLKRHDKELPKVITADTAREECEK